MAVRSLSEAQRRRGLLAGSGLAILLRIVLTFFAARILELPLFKLVGGVLIFWVALKLLADSESGPESAPGARSLRQAIWVILVADFTMSLDNILAVAAASKGSLTLLIVGLALSISFVVFMSGFLARLMDRFPVVLYGGAAILGQVAGDMIAHDPWVLRVLPAHPENLTIAFEAGLATGVLLTGWIVRKNKRKKTASPSV